MKGMAPLQKNSNRCRIYGANRIKCLTRLYIRKSRSDLPV